MIPWKAIQQAIVLADKAYELARKIRARIIGRRIEEQRVEQQQYNDEWARKHKRGKYRERDSW